MAFCSKCGTKLEEGAVVCSSCGAQTGVRVVEKTDFTDEMNVQDIAENRYLAALTYLGVLFIVLAIVVKPDSKFVRFHANQSLVLQVAAVLVGLACIVPLAGLIVAAVSPILTLIILIFQIIGAVGALQNKAKYVPVVGKVKII